MASFDDGYGTKVDISDEGVANAAKNVGKEVSLGNGYYGVMNSDGTMAVRSDSGYYATASGFTPASSSNETSTVPSKVQSRFDNYHQNSDPSSSSAQVAANSSQPYGGGSTGGSSAGSAANGAAETPYQTTYINPISGEEFVGYIINGKTYTDPEGTTEVPMGSYVTDKGGRIWYKQADGSILVSSPNPEDHYDRDEATANIKHIEFINPVTGKTNYFYVDPVQGKSVIYDSNYNSLGYVDSAGVHHITSPDDYTRATSNAAIEAAKAAGISFDGDGIVKIPIGGDLNLEKTLLIQQYWNEIQAGGDGEATAKKIKELDQKNKSSGVSTSGGAEANIGARPESVNYKESTLNLQPISETAGMGGFNYTPAPNYENMRTGGTVQAPTLQSADLGNLRQQGLSEAEAAYQRANGGEDSGNVIERTTSEDYNFRPPETAMQESAQQGYMNANAEQAERSYTNVTAPERAEYNPADLTTQINKVHDEAFNLAKTQIENQLAQGELEIDQAIEKLPAIYEAGMNDMAQQFELNKRNANEYFNANGLTSGARAQSLLAMNNVYQANLAAYRMEQANAIQNYEDKRAQLKLEAQGAITEALLQNEQNRASDLLTEWQRQDEENLKLFLEQLDQDYKYYALELDKQLKEASLAEEQRQFDITTEENRITRDLNYNLDVAKLEEQARQADNENSIKLYQIAESIREFNASHDLDLAKLQENARQADNELQLAQAKFDEGVREFNLGYNVDLEKLKESVRQAENDYALSYAKFEEAVREFEAEYAYKYSALNEDARQFNEQMEYNYSKAGLSGNPSLALSLDEGEDESDRANMSYDNSFEGFAERVQDADYYSAVAKISSSRMSEAQARAYIRSLSTDLFSDTSNKNLTDAQIQLIMKDAELLRNIRS